MKFLNVFVAVAVVLTGVDASRISQRVSARARRTTPFTGSTSLEALASNNTHAEFSTNWSGAVIETPPSGQTFKSVTGTFTVPTITGSGAASAWVGIDGDTAQNSILQAGVDFEISGGRTTFTAWTEWFPNFASDISNFAISAGDKITVTVTASSTTAGTATLTNATKGKTVTISLRAPSSSAALAGQNAEWIVEDFEENGSLVTLANFGTVTFTGSSASTGSSSVTPSGATIINMEQNNKVLTSVSISGSTVTVKHT